MDFFVVLSCILLAALILQVKRYLNIQKEIRYISGRLNTIQLLSENSFLLLPTDHASIKELICAENRLLHDFYKEKNRFEQTKEAMAQVMTNISHDLRTPLTVLKGNTEMLVLQTDDTVRLPDSVRAIAGKVDSKADELIRTIGDYFTLARLASGDYPLKLQRENISQICHDVILDYYDLLEDERFSVEILLPSVPVYADTDAESLKRILKNLIDNAILHGGGGKYLALRVSSAENRTIIEVEDHGKGIPEQYRRRIFSRNYTTAPRSSGNGLGLTIARSLAAKTGAEITVQSTKNEKTVFSIIIKR